MCVSLCLPKCYCNSKRKWKKIRHQDLLKWKDDQNILSGEQKEAEKSMHTMNQSINQSIYLSIYLSRSRCT
jgi:hypothetical protein